MLIHTDKVRCVLVLIEDKKHELDDSDSLLGLKQLEDVLLLVYVSL